jgi:tricorn protease
MSEGYYRFPTIHGDRVAFVCEDDLWTVPASGGVARRLTSNLGAVSRAVYSPGGSFLAFTGCEEGPPEVYCMPADGGAAERLTWLGATTSVVGWTPDGAKVVLVSNARQPMARIRALFTVGHDGSGMPEQLGVGPATDIAYGPDEAVVLGRNTADPARWKRYRGGTAGELWIDTDGSGTFRKLVDLKGNLASPMWIGERIYFLSDHEGVGNLYSCTPDGGDVERHTDHEDFYVRYPATDGQRVVYHAGADLYLYDPATGDGGKIDVEFRSPRVQCNRKFVAAEKFLDGYALHPKGHSVALTSRGKAFTMALWEGAVRQHGDADDARSRLAEWLPDGERIVLVSDEGGEERLEVHRADLSAPPVVLDGLDLGRVYGLSVCPKDSVVSIANHRYELTTVDLDEGKANVVDRSEFAGISSGAWSADGRWLAYTFANTRNTLCLKLYSVDSGETREVTRSVLKDAGAAWDPDGKYLYFLGARDLDPVYDHLHFDLNFPRGVRPYLITLRKDVPSPFVPVPRAPGEKPEGEKNDKPKDEEKKDEPKPVEVDLDGIEHRVIAFPVPLGRYGQIAGLSEGRVLFTTFPVEGALGRTWFDEDAGAKGSLEQYDFGKEEKETLLSGVDDLVLSQDGKTMLMRSKKRLRALKAGVKPDEKAEKEKPGRKSGWLDLGRARVSVVPLAEWRQMFREAWRLQRDHFWTEDMSKVDWEAVYDRYLPLVDRLGSRAEFSDLMWEMQGELGTSHAYEMGGDYRKQPHYGQGLLGADLEYEPEAAGYRVVHVVRGDSWNPKADSPLNAPGINVGPGDVLTAVEGRALRADLPPDRLLVHRAGTDVSLTVADEDAPRVVCVKTLSSEFEARYREWVEANRERVHRETDGRVGYVHVPDMGPKGYAEFHRLYLSEFDHDGLVVDVRYNGGGHVSQLLLEKLGRRRIGYDKPRWGSPYPYPEYSVAGPMVAVTNESAGSDGDIFSHCFKLMGLGPLIGKRTWGGVIGIGPRNRFVDGGLTTQPEYSFWFKDVGWGVENYGTDPDIEVDITPQDYAAGRDPQLEKAIEIILKALEENPPERPTFEDRPNLSLPKLPPRQ